ncbi:hypothetical protein ACFX2J_042647 [Malus domestica]
MSKRDGDHYLSHSTHLFPLLFLIADITKRRPPPIHHITAVMTITIADSSFPTPIMFLNFLSLLDDVTKLRLSSIHLRHLRHSLNSTCFFQFLAETGMVFMAGRRGITSFHLYGAAW